MFDIQTNEDNKDIEGSDDEGVSPVIGVILMVATTVILAAVVGAFVFDMAGSLQQNAQASVQFSEDTTNNAVTARAVSMQNADFVELRANADSGELTSVSGDIGTDAGGQTDTHNSNSTGLTASKVVVDLEAAGNSASFSYSPDGFGTITVVGYLKGNGSVLQTYEYAEQNSTIYSTGFNNGIDGWQTNTGEETTRGQWLAVACDTDNQTTDFYKTFDQPKSPDKISYSTKVAAVDSWDGESLKLKFRDDNGWHTVESENPQNSSTNSTTAYDCNSGYTGDVYNWSGTFDVTGTLYEVRVVGGIQQNDYDESIAIDYLEINKS